MNIENKVLLINIECFSQILIIKILVVVEWNYL